MAETVSKGKWLNIGPEFSVILEDFPEATV
jgi:hypothetical protein